MHINIPIPFGKQFSLHLRNFLMAIVHPTPKTGKVRIVTTKYYNRASTRCTPFGLFAGCSIGRIGEETLIELESLENCKRCTRLDMQYLCALIQEIERTPEIREILRYYPNDSLYKLGNKYRYIEYHYKKRNGIIM